MGTCSLQFFKMQTSHRVQVSFIGRLPDEPKPLAKGFDDFHRKAARKLEIGLQSAKRFVGVLNVHGPSVPIETLIDRHHYNVNYIVTHSVIVYLDKGP